MRFFIMRIEELEFRMLKRDEIVRTQDDVGGWGRNGQERRGADDAGENANESGKEISYAATVGGGMGVVQNFC
ncbi:MAG TPA: hypothetical protein VNV43_13960 [Candidatus Acidoferrales bacterium]|jgi:hypothetical protein|nr:hypothetical protein [Candidatus Acidoferrales bacterium]